MKKVLCAFSYFTRDLQRALHFSGSNFWRDLQRALHFSGSNFWRDLPRALALRCLTVVQLSMEDVLEET